MEHQDKAAINITREALLAAIENMTKNKVVIVGDVMLDEYIFGSVERISPEAPVPVVCVENEEYRLGGAGNVAKNITTLGGKVQLFGFLGQDQAAKRISDMFAAHAIDDCCVKECDRPTTRKTRIIAQQQQVVRVDRESSCIPSDGGMRHLLHGVAEAMRTSSVLIISDYGKGLITGSVMDEIRLICEALEHKPRIIVDPKPRNFPFYNGVTMLTPNTKEAGIDWHLAAGRQKNEEAINEEIFAVGNRLMRELQSQHLLITMGARGMMLFMSQQQAIHIPTAARKVYDVTGAGDTVIAVLGLALASGLDPLTGCLLANYAAGIVVGQVGATAVSPKQLKEAVLTWSLPEVRQIAS
ncbi:rfaE bifunctional protein, domain I [Desulfonatronum thiosulfatophilum]|uniref:RfaE bifunctional protein, domain I n=1 Tax=Desulfonatronum thiosulfatophilum TaxID=617002 RepID=A0A1G6B8K9_9BACT|nr:D-glycero-beta-D-manno-heptose-7-phosphate kinase [Desulfonatronum thiosulfatophilum]SDB16992.1 rfaE bifunctional protein, domain I [Desulfonatronum thiosulfatophilum]